MRIRDLIARLLPPSGPSNDKGLSFRSFGKAGRTGISGSSPCRGDCSAAG